MSTTKTIPSKAALDCAAEILTTIAANAQVQINNVQAFEVVLSIQNAINAILQSALAELPEVPTDYPFDDEGAESYADAISQWRSLWCERAGVKAEG